MAEVGNPLLTDNLTFMKSERALIVYYLKNGLELIKEKHSRANLNFIFQIFCVIGNNDLKTLFKWDHFELVSFPVKYQEQKGLVFLSQLKNYSTRDC